MTDTKIVNWTQVNGFFDAEGVTEDTLDKLWKNFDVENLDLADIEFKIYGPNYNSSIRSDFAEGIASFQSIFNRQLLFILEDKNPYRQLQKTDKENFLFYISIQSGCTDVILKITKPLINVLAKKLKTMKPCQICIFFFILTAIYESPKFYETWTEYSIKKQQLEQERSNAKFEALMKLSESDVFKRFVNSQDYQNIKYLILDDVSNQQIRATNELIRNTADVERIELNSESYNVNDIKRIKETPDEDVIPSASKFVEGEFLVTSIDRLHYPYIKLHLKSVNKKNATVDASLNCEEGSLTDEQIKLIWMYCEQGQPLNFKLNETIAKDGKIKSAYVEYVSTL